MTNYEPPTLRHGSNEFPSARFSHTARRLLGSLWAQWRQAQKMARDTHRLEQLPDRLLKDMGLQRTGLSRRPITRLPDALARAAETPQ